MWNDLMQEMDQAIEDNLVDGIGKYHHQGQQIEGVAYILDSNFQIYDENQLHQVVTTISIPSKTISKSKSGDRFVTLDRDWKIHQTLEDDGRWRRLYVS